MALLQAILDKNIQLFDYEAIAEDVKDPSTGKIKKQRKNVVLFKQNANACTKFHHSSSSLL